MENGKLGEKGDEIESNKFVYEGFVGD